MSATNKTETHDRLLSELRALQADLRDNWLDRSLPEDWDGLDATAPVERMKDKVTLRLDADMVRWFRRLGPGYGARINRVLRIYWTGLITGRIKAHWNEEEATPPFLEYVERLAELREGRGR
jgi:uncharacterized protein (DUF4415 family)